MSTLPLADGPVVDGSRALRRAVRRSGRGERIVALLLLLPLLAFLSVTFVLPLGRIVTLSLFDIGIRHTLPHVADLLREWPGTGEPPQGAYGALASDLVAAKASDMTGTLANRLNVERPGMRSLVNRTVRELGTSPTADPRARLLAIDPAWAEPALWTILARLSRATTPAYYLAALDLGYGADGSIVQRAPDQRVHRSLFLRTFAVSGAVTVLCILLGYPVAYLLATAGRRSRSILLALVLLPFWTSLLVRTTSWIILLQSKGVINDLLVWLGVIDEAGRITMIYNVAGTLIAMTHILLPFFILPLYSGMVTIPTSYMRAAQSLGARGVYAFRRVYLPLTLPGVGSGGLLVFILAVGYYITPALVGGQSGQMISNIIAYHVQSSLNWGLAAALGVLLLAAVSVLYAIYYRLAGNGRFRFG